MSWSVTFRGTSTEIDAAFDAEVERLRALPNSAPVGEFEDLHQARILALAAISAHDCQLQGSANGWWLGVHFQSFELRMKRYIPPDEVQLQFPSPERVTHDGCVESTQD